MNASRLNQRDRTLRGLQMFKAVRARMGALVGKALGRTRAARRDAGMVTQCVAALSVSHADVSHTWGTDLSACAALARVIVSLC